MARKHIDGVDSATVARGRGVPHNPANRFERLWLEPLEGANERTTTAYMHDATRTIVARNISPDIPFDTSLNPYRGCEHGCVYCYARPTHEYLGFSAGLDFETRILVKTAAPELLRRELESKRWSPQVLSLSGVTDPYQPIERRLELTRRCLQVLAEFRNPVAIVTKNELVTRDLDILGRLAERGAAIVYVSVTTLDDELCGAMEPRTSRPARRIRALQQIAAAGIPCGVMVAPVVPGLTDHEMPAILQAAGRAGATRASYATLRLPGAVADIFEGWLQSRSAARRRKVMARIRSLRNGRRNDPRFETRMQGEGAFAEQIAALFAASCRRLGLNARRLPLSTKSFRRSGQQRLPLVDITSEDARAVQSAGATMHNTD